MGNPSVAYEVLIYLNSFYFGMFASCELSMGLLKAINLKYENHMLAKDSIILLVLIIVEAIRIILGRKGALADRDWRVIISVILIIPCLSCVIYLLRFQSYVLKLEYCLGTLMTMLYLSELWFSVKFVFSLFKPISYG